MAPRTPVEEVPQTLEAAAGESERRIYQAVASMSEFEAEQLAASNPVAGV